MEQSIIVGMTDTDAGRRALDWASARAAERGSRLELMTVLGGVVGVVGEGRIVAESMREASSMLDREADRLRRSGIRVETRVDRGDPVDRLIDASTVFDLLVIGADERGAGGKSHRGSHSIRIVAGASCPVAVVPPAHPAGRRGVVVGIDGSTTSERALSFALAEAELTGEPLTVVRTWQPVPLPVTMAAYPHDYLAGVQKLAEEDVEAAVAGRVAEHPAIEVRHVIERGFPGHRISELARRARMAVVGSHGRGPIARFFLGSTSQSVLDEMPAVVVVVK